MSSVTLPINGYADDYAYSMVSSSYPLSNAVGATSSDGTKYAGISLTNGNGADTYVYMTFDTPAIPQNARIISVTGSVKIYGSSAAQGRTTTREIQLYSGSTPKGVATSYALTGAATIYEITNSGSWTRNELNDIRIRLYAKRNSSNTTSNTYVYWLGGDVTIEYEEGGGGGGNSGESQTVTSTPTAYTTSGSTITGTKYRNAIGKDSSATATGNDYVNSSSGTANIIYSFDFSSIPENAIIESVEVKVGGHCESTSNSNRKADLQLYSDNTAKGDKSSFTSTNKQIITMNAGSWTRTELQNAKLYFTIGYYGGLVNGVDFTVTYHVPGTSNNTRLRVKINGTYKKVTKILCKENGAYVEKSVDDLPTENLKIL